MKTTALAFRLRPYGILAAAILTLLPACTGRVATLAAGATGGTLPTTPSTGSGGSPGVTPGSVRFANLSQQIGPFDVCADSPLLGLAGGLQFGEVSRYFPPPEPHGAPWMLVSPGDGSCWDPAAVPIPVSLPANAEGARVTIVPWRTLVDGGEETTFFTFVDERVNDHYGIDLRALNFTVWGPDDSEGPMISMLQQGPGDPQPALLFSNLAFAKVGAHSGMGEVTAAGFVHTPYIGVGELDVVPDAYTAELVMPGDVPVPGGEGNAYGIGSIFVAGSIYDGSTRAIVCSDDSAPDGARSSCTVLSPKSP